MVWDGGTVGKTTFGSCIMIRILLLSAIKFDGTSFYRGIGPFAHLRKMFGDVEIIDADVAQIKDTVIDWTNVSQVDVFFMQRPSQDHEATLMKLANYAKVPIIADYDDDYCNIPSTNPRAPLYMNETRQAIIRECLERADCITVSTPAIAQAYGQIVSKDKIIVVPNGYDPTLFSDQPYLGPRQKIIAWRGGDTHEADLLTVKDQILRLIKRFPDYKWAFLGYTPEWITSDLEIPHDQLILFTFQDIHQYFDTLNSMRPEIAIVPLQDNAFNHGKSNISALEFGLAGTLTIAPKWDKFIDSGCITYTDAEDFERQVVATIELKDKKTVYQNALGFVKKFSLAEINKQRYNIIKEVLEKKKNTKFYPTIMKKTPMTDLEYYQHCLKRGLIQENENYAKAHHALADWLVTRLDPEDAVDFGCGPGAVIERLLQQNVKAFGLEKNEYFVEYFITRNPVHELRVNRMDFSHDELKLDKPFDLAIAIHVFETIDKSDEWWNEFIKMLSTKFKYFYLVSTPYYLGERNDQRQHHVNIRRFEKWKELFEAQGWKYLENPKQIAAYDLLFESKAFIETEMTVLE